MITFVSVFTAPHPAWKVEIFASMAGCTLLPYAIKPNRYELQYNNVTYMNIKGPPIRHFKTLHDARRHINYLLRMRAQYLKT